MQTITSGGASIPALGFGTYRMTPHEVERIVPDAVRAGFRHFDTAQIYGNEGGLGVALERAGARREDLFVTTKIWVSNYAGRRFAQSLDESLSKLRMDYVDLLLLHWRSRDVPLEAQIEGLERARDAGKTRHIGVSNFTIALVKESRRLARSPIVCNQVEIHPYIDQSSLLTAMKEMGVAAAAYYAMADGRVITDPNIRAIGKEHGKGPAQVVLRWLVQQGIVALSKTVHPDRLRENIDIFDFELNDREMAQLHELAMPDGRLVSPPGLAPRWDR